MTNLFETTEQSWDGDVLQADGTVLVDFWAEWCSPCKMMEPILAELAERYADKISIVKLDVHEYPDIAMRYGVLNLPALILFQEGEAKQQIAGYMPLAALENKLKEYV